MDEQISREEAEQHLRSLAHRADDVVGTHIRGVTLGHDDLRKLSEAVRILLGPDPSASSEQPSA